jgi:serine-threonine kinase receptor-associated protein
MGKLTSSKIWDCNSGEALHSFAHNHIVRSVALNPQQTPQYLLTVSQLAAL